MGVAWRHHVAVAAVAGAAAARAASDLTAAQPALAGGTASSIAAPARELAANMAVYLVLIVVVAFATRMCPRFSGRERSDSIELELVRTAERMGMKVRRPSEDGMPAGESGSDEPASESEGDDEAGGAGGAGRARRAHDPDEQFASLTRHQRLGMCIMGLHGSYLLWGILQERILTTSYGDDGQARFTSSQFLVFSNRCVSFVISATLVLYFKPERSRMPLLDNTFTSASNLLSSWCQYEALQYVSFPTQMLSKSFKIIPVMIMGRLVSKKWYPCYEYAVAFTIATGVFVFVVSMEHLEFSSGDGDEGESRSWVGVFLLGVYMAFDSFTSQWQTRCFNQYHLSPYQMMFAVNGWSALFSCVSLTISGEMAEGTRFIHQYPEICLHIALFALCSTVGQLFIFYTIKQFGALVFVVVMTTRQLLSILISCAIFGHPISQTSYLGLVLVFAPVAYRVCRHMEGSPSIFAPQQKISAEQAHTVVGAWTDGFD